MRHRGFWLLLLLFSVVALVAPVLAASPKSFCKCTCNGESKIFDLDAPTSPEIKRQPAGDGLSRKKTCNDCNRQYCLSYAFCAGVKEEDVTTACFQRDSAKDQAVVYIFIIATVGLLGYAAVRPWVERWAERHRDRRDYIPVSSQAEQ